MKPRQSGRAIIIRAAFFAGFAFAMIVGIALIFVPNSPLPNGWNPTKPLRVADDVTAITPWKLRRTANDPTACIAALEGAAQITQSPTFQDANPNCFISNPVKIDAVGLAQMSGVKTDCGTALRVAMWEQHTLQPKAEQQLGLKVTAITDIGSYNCRAMRTTAGVAARLSSHATASAIDISGFQFSDGSRLNLTRDWNGSDNGAAFLRAARDGACEWFPLTLSPDYNALHSDHFHLQANGWNICD